MLTVKKEHCSIAKANDKPLVPTAVYSCEERKVSEQQWFWGCTDWLIRMTFWMQTATACFD
jgi:hypothetical protein